MRKIDYLCIGAVGGLAVWSAIRGDWWGFAFDLAIGIAVYSALRWLDGASRKVNVELEYRRPTPAALPPAEKSVSLKKESE